MTDTPPPQAAEPTGEKGERDAAQKIRLEAYYANVRMRSEGLFQLGILGIKSLTLLNGGAIVALFTLLGHTENLNVQGDLLWLGFAGFVGGVICAMASLLLGYVAQNELALYEMHLADAVFRYITASVVNDPDKKQIRRGNSLLVWAVVAAGLSLGGLIFGSSFSLMAVHVEQRPVVQQLPNTGSLTGRSGAASTRSIPGRNP